MKSWAYAGHGETGKRGGHCNDYIAKGGEVMGDVTELDQRRRKVPDRLQVAREKLIDVLDGLRVGTLTKQQADAIQEAIEEELKLLRRDAGL
jgi:hypothetical protein